MTDALLSQRRQKTRLIFIHAFLRLIVTRDLDKITVSDIANEADYGRWAFYQYFESKEAIAFAAFFYWMNELDAYVLSVVKDLASPEREYRSWNILCRAFEQQQAFFSRLDSLIASEWYSRAKEFLVEQFLSHLRTGRFALMNGVRPEIAARLYVVSIMELIEYWHSHPETESIDALVDEFFIFIFNQAPPNRLAK